MYLRQRTIRAVKKALRRFFCALYLHMSDFCCTFAVVMEVKSKKKQQRLIRKWVRLVLAIAASVLLLNKPVYNFPDELGMEHVRTYIMTTRTFEVHHIEMSTGMDDLMGTMSVKGFFFGALAMLIGCVICTVFYSDHIVRVLSSTITAYLAGAYYLIMIYYAVRLSQKFFLIIYPNWIAMLPLVVLLTMLSIRKETVHRLVDAKEKAEEGL